MLTAAPMALAAGVPWLLVAVYADRLPDHAYVYGWSRVGPEYAYLAPTWTSWSAGWSYCLLCAALLGAVSWRLRRWPQLQRTLVAVGWAIGARATAEATCGVLALLDVPGYPDQPMAWWHSALQVVVGLLGGVAGWALAGSAPSLPETTDVPPPDLPARRLGRTERAMFSEVVWSTKARVVGAVLLLCVPLVLLLDPHRSGLAVVLLVLGLGLALQAKARVQVDGEGVLLTLPLLVRARRRVPYRHVRHAEVAEHGPTPRRGLVEDKRHWGYVAGRGPALVLRLTDDRSFIASLRDPATAVALINGHLTRQRATGTTTGA